ncbi:uncharacterized protein [Heterodontus francisci]|uniref:uncharacterized protein n=1 Tax=Heterodontus francisci TaxID=7792 RepID=UPI00355C4F5B
MTENGITVFTETRYVDGSGTVVTITAGFVVSVNKAEKTFSLKIGDVRVEDSATYYCKAEYDGTGVDTRYVDGSGTVVTITADSLSQSVRQTPAAVTRKECQSLTITCVFDSGNSCHYFKNGHFFRQTQTGTERERISGGGRFVVSVNKAEKTFSLKIGDVRVEDSATYYCKAEYDGTGVDTRYVDGSGTVVTITADSGSLVSRSPPLQTSAAGDIVTVSCEYSGFCQYTVHWYRLSPGQAPKYLLQRHTSGDQNKENTAGGRISASIDPAERISRLKIYNLQLSDSAVYYCALSQRTAQ